MTENFTVFHTYTFQQILRQMKKSRYMNLLTPTTNVTSYCGGFWSTEALLGNRPVSDLQLS